MAIIGDSPWMPGMPGKGFLLDDGRVATWSTDREGNPWHTVFCDQLTGKPHGYSSPITIAPDGRCVASNELRERPAPRDGQEELVAASHALLKLGDVATYLQSGQRAYAHADRLAARVPVQDLAKLPPLLAGALAKLPCENTTKVSVWLGTPGWGVRPNIEEQGDEIADALPSAAKPAVFRQRQIGPLSATGHLTYLHDMVRITVTVPDVSAGRALTVELSDWLAARASEHRLLLFPYGMAPAGVAEAAWQQSERKEAAKEAARAAAAPTEQECVAALDAMARLRNPEQHRSFHCERDIAAQAGIDRARIYEVLLELAAQKKVRAGDFTTRHANMGSWWALPVSLECLA
jgi:hypothetical protein